MSPLYITCYLSNTTVKSDIYTTYIHCLETGLCICHTRPLQLELCVGCRLATKCLNLNNMKYDRFGCGSELFFPLYVHADGSTNLFIVIVYIINNHPSLRGDYAP